MTTETAYVPRELLETLIEEHITALGFTNPTAREAQLILAQPVAREPVAFDWPEYNDMAMGCGLEDRGITDRYEAMRYGWDEAAERYAEIARAEPLFCKPPAPAVLEGYALVPIEPTREMFVAANKADDAAFGGGSAHGATAEDVWYAMIDAAQQPIIEG